MEQKIFPGSLYLLIFQFLAAALSAGAWGKGQVHCGRRGSCGARPSVLGRPEAVGPEGRPVSLTCSLRRIQELPGPPWAAGTTAAGALGSVALGGPAGRSGPRVCHPRGDVGASGEEGRRSREHPVSEGASPRARVGQPGLCSSDRTQRSRGTDDGEGQSSDKVQTPFLTLVGSHNERALQQKLDLIKLGYSSLPPCKVIISSLQKMELGEVK